MLTDASLLLDISWNPFAITSLLAAGFMLSLAWYLFLWYRTSSGNIIFILLVTLLGIVAFSETWQRLSLHAEAAFFWEGIGFAAWALIMPLFFHFSLFNMRREKIAKSPILHLALYLPAILFILVGLETSLIFDHERTTYFLWGWQTPYSLLGNGIFMPWFWWIGAIAFWLFVKEFGRRGVSPKEKRLALFMLLSAAVLFVTSALYQVLLPYLGIDSVPMTSAIMPLFAFAIFFQLTRRKLLGLDSPALSAAIIEALGDALIVTDTRGSIQFANRAAEELFGISQRDFSAKDISVLFPRSGEDFENFAGNVLAKVKEGRTVRNFETDLLGADAEPFPVLISAGAVVLPGIGERVAGIVFFIHDNRRLRNLLGDLQIKNKELSEVESRLRQQLKTLS